jgi:cytoskeletal protein CcmA (bactofilin family)
MARFKRFKAPKISTVIGQQTEVSGDITFAGGLHVDGTIRGNVTAEVDQSSALTLSEAGRIEGDVRVPNVILNGSVSGDVYASQRVELAPNAKVNGTVYYRLLEMTMGAEVNGQLVHTEEEPIRMLGYDSPSEPTESQAADEPQKAEMAAVTSANRAGTPQPAGDSPQEPAASLRERRGR